MGIRHTQAIIYGLTGAGGVTAASAICYENKTAEIKRRDYYVFNQRDSSGGQRRQINRGPAGGNTGQRSVVRNPQSITPLDVEEANGRGTNVGREDK